MEPVIIELCLPKGKSDRKKITPKFWLCLYGLSRSIDKKKKSDHFILVAKKNEKIVVSDDWGNYSCMV